MKMPLTQTFNRQYFIQGPYQKSIRAGFGRYFNQFYWARRFYAGLIAKHKKGGSLLEIGCGFGDQIHFLADSFNCTGIDISADAIRIAKSFKKADFKVLPAEQIICFGRSCFDVVLANYVLEHLKDPGLVISHCYKILKPGGCFFIAVPNLSSLTRYIKTKNWVGFRDKTHISLYEPAQWQKLLTERGFSITKKISDGFWDVPYTKILPNWFQLLLFDSPGIIQTIFTLNILPQRFGEGLIIIAQKKN